MKTEINREIWIKNKRTNLTCFAYCMFEDQLTKQDMLNMVRKCDIKENDPSESAEYEALKISIPNFEKIFGNHKMPPNTKWLVIRFFKDTEDGDAVPLKDYIEENDDKIKVWITLPEKDSIPKEILEHPILLTGQNHNEDLN